MISFTIPLIPKAQMRGRSFVKKTKTGKYYSGIHKATEQDTYEGQLMGLLERHRPPEPLEGAIKLKVEVYLPIPSSKSDWWKEAASKCIINHTTKPDLDNLVKNIKDCMTMVGFYHDDRQIVIIDAAKFYSKNPRWEIELINFTEPKSKKEYLEAKEHEKKLPSVSQCTPYPGHQDK